DIGTKNQNEKIIIPENPSARDSDTKNTIRKIEIDKELKLKAIQAHQTQKYSTQRLISFLQSDNPQANFETIQILQRRCCSHLITAIPLPSPHTPLATMEGTSATQWLPVLSDTPLLVKERGRKQNFSDKSLLNEERKRSNTLLLNKERGRKQNFSDKSLLNEERKRSNTPLLNTERGRGEVKSQTPNRDWNSTYNSIQQRDYPRNELVELLKQQAETWGNLFVGLGYKWNSNLG
ncbi:MAG: hypothetical protein AAFW70_31035, partial [Cyanobacteria bacterium J06635_10]